ncbi:cytochrome c [Geobacter sp. SVR]|uniref:c-type cytochrome n=1 Tax=Geobacter sp. SVR TaxID=2495594 RepID=UPI00143EFE89|nr:cytochrome c [Geobacter sp. SVR]BCS53000.1 hypothetical protein GSVR_13080 [Geobacter sp. SVR]GCF84385.1 hypothetical protein GSbR_09850 [Geobacter sp. SVR]
MSNRAKNLVAVLMCANLVQFGTIAVAATTESDTSAPGGSTYESDGGSLRAPSPVPKPTMTPSTIPKATMTPAPTSTPKPAATPASAQDGASLYNTYCSGCHGASKRGSSASSIQNAINGNRGGMGFLNTLTPAQLKAISQY